MYKCPLTAFAPNDLNFLRSLTKTLLEYGVEDLVLDPGTFPDEGLADTIRVSLTAQPEEEVRVAFLILSSLGLRSRGPNIISCPICGRCEVDMFKISAEIEKRLASIKEHIDVAIMGCVVNGPGEAKEADIGLACGRGIGVIFKKGKLLRRLEEDEIVPEFVKEVKSFAKKASKLKSSKK